jgi:hypothetical protein
MDSRFGLSGVPRMKQTASAAGRDSSGVREASATSGGVRRGLKHSAVNVHNEFMRQGGIGLIDNCLRLIDNKPYCFRNNYLSVDLLSKKLRHAIS